MTSQAEDEDNEDDVDDVDQREDMDDATRRSLDDVTHEGPR